MDGVLEGFPLSGGDAGMIRRDGGAMDRGALPREAAANQIEMH